MFTWSMVHSVLLTTLPGQPAPVAASLQWIINVITHHLTLVNLLIAVVQAEIGLLLLSGLWVRGALIASLVWALIVWYGGEGMSMLLTGQASALTGAPGAVLFYPLLGLLVYPRSASLQKSSQAAGAATNEWSLLSPAQFRWVLAGFWIFAALLQLQPFWWQPGQISETMGDLIGQGGLNTVLVDPLLQALSPVTASLEIPLNCALIVAFLGLGVALTVARQGHLRYLLGISIALSIMLWWGTQAFGLIFTGMATDFNSGLLLVLMALACWPKALPLGAAQNLSPDHLGQPEGSTPLAQPSVS